MKLLVKCGSCGEYLTSDEYHRQAETPDFVLCSVCQHRVMKASKRLENPMTNSLDVHIEQDIERHRKAVRASLFEAFVKARIDI